MHTRFDAITPLRITETLGKYDVTADVRGGGPTGQAGAIRLGLSRSLCSLEPDLRSQLKPGTISSHCRYSVFNILTLLCAAKMLRRDPRSVERKKAGQPGARKKRQW